MHSAKGWARDVASMLSLLSAEDAKRVWRALERHDIASVLLHMRRDCANDEGASLHFEDVLQRVGVQLKVRAAATAGSGHLPNRN